MSVAEKSAFPNSANTFSNLHSVIPLRVMGILIVMVLPMSTMTMNLLISLNAALSIIVTLVSMHILQPVQFSVSPSLLLFTTRFHRTVESAISKRDHVVLYSPNTKVHFCQLMKRFAANTAIPIRDEMLPSIRVLSLGMVA